MEVYREVLGLVPGWAWVLIGVGFVVAVLMCIMIGRFAGRHERASTGAELDRQRDQSDRWAAARDVEDLVVDGYDPRRLRIGYLPARGRRLPRWRADELRRLVLTANPRYRSLLVIAPSGAGKTPRVVVPILLTFTGPAVACSVKPDGMRLTRHRREQVGTVWLYDPTGATGGRSCRWSPLAEVHDYAGALRAASWLADAGRAHGGGADNEDFWLELGTQMMAPLLFLAAVTGHTITDVAAWAADPGAEQRLENQLTDTGDQAALAAWRTHRAITDKTKSSVVQTVRTVLRAWGHPDVAAAVDHRPEAAGQLLDLNALLDSTDTLYVQAPASEQQLFRPLFESLIGALVKTVEARAQRRPDATAPAHPLLLMLDEAANIAPVRRLDQVASKSAQEGIIVCSVWQDEGQIEQTYGPARARTVVSNHYTHVFLPGIEDLLTLRHLTERVGEDTITRTSTSTSEHGLTHSASSSEISVAPPHYLATLDPEQAIVTAGGHKPMRVLLPGWWQDPTLRPLVDPAVADAFDTAYAPQRRRSARRRAHKVKVTVDA